MPQDWQSSPLHTSPLLKHIQISFRLKQAQESLAAAMSLGDISDTVTS